jgi:cephalosporin hydroxylase
MNIVAQSPGHFEFRSDFDSKNYSASQMIGVWNYFRTFLLQESFDAIIELGTFKGGTTIMVNDLIRELALPTAIHTFDITESNDGMSFEDLKRSFLERGITFLKTNVFSDNTIKDIINLIKGNKKVCVLCDGGDKIKEFNYFSDLIKPGDFIMAHDYHHDIQPYDCSWRWQEIKYSNIATSVDRNKLKLYEKVKFPEVAWACFSK